MIKFKIKPFLQKTTKTGKEKTRLFLVEVVGASTLYYAETLSQAFDFIRGYKKQPIHIKTRSYTEGIKARIRDERILSI